MSQQARVTGNPPISCGPPSSHRVMKRSARSTWASSHSNQFHHLLSISGKKNSLIHWLGLAHLARNTSCRSCLFTRAFLNAESLTPDRGFKAF
jgi:hypothetical protein